MAAPSRIAPRRASSRGSSETPSIDDRPRTCQRDVRPEEIEIVERDLGGRQPLRAGGRGRGDRHRADAISSSDEARAARGRSRATRCAAARLRSLREARRAWLPLAASRDIGRRRRSCRRPARRNRRRRHRSRSAGATIWRKCLAARLVVAELVETGAGRARAASTSPGCAAAIARLTASPSISQRSTGMCGSSRSANMRARLADGVGGGDIAEIGRAIVEIVALGQARRTIQWMRGSALGRKGRQRRGGGGRVGRLAVVDEQSRRRARRRAPSGAAGRGSWRGPRAICVVVDSPSSRADRRPRWRRSAGCAAPAGRASRPASGPAPQVVGAGRPALPHGAPASACWIALVGASVAAEHGELAGPPASRTAAPWRSA